MQMSNLGMNVAYGGLGVTWTNFTIVGCIQRIRFDR